MRLFCVVGASALLTLCGCGGGGGGGGNGSGEQPVTSCADLAGSWNFSESGSITWTVGGQSETENLGGSGQITIAQDGCNISWTEPTYNETRSGTIDANGNVQVSGRFVVPLVGSVTLTKNTYTAKGTLSADELTIDLTGTGFAEGTYEGVNFSCTGTDKVKLTRKASPGEIPVPPTGLSATAGDRQISIGWNSVTGATSYNLYWSTANGVTKTTGTKISNVTSPYVHTGLTNGTTYYYVVTAVNSNGESRESPQVSAVPGSISSPIGVTATPGERQISIGWNSVPEATSYNLYWSTTKGVTKTSGTKISNVTNPYVHTGLTNGTTYYYVVTAENTHGESRESSEVSASPATAPSPPTGVTASSGVGQVTIAWSSATGATAYNIYWATTSGVTKSTGTKISNVTSPYVHTGLSDGTTYYYVVTATNSYGESAESSEASAITSPPSLVSQKGTITATGDKQYYQVTIGSGQNLIVTLDVPANQYYYLYVKLGSLPTTTNYDAKSDVFGAGLDQAVTINNTQAGTYYIMVYANIHSSAYSGTYTITASP